MRIVIVGAGAVGSYLAERLSAEGQDVVVIEDDEELAADLQDRIDALVIPGNGASPSVLEQAGVQKSDLLIAVSNSDGANVLACHVAAELGVKRTVARVEDPDMREALAGLEVDFVIDPGEAASHELLALVRQSGVSELVEFGGGKLALVGATVPPGAPLVGRNLGTLRRIDWGWEWVVTAIVRHGTTIVAHGDTVIEPGDHVLLMVASDDVDRSTDLLGVSHHTVRRVIILGSTRLADLTAGLCIDAGFDVVIVDQDPGRCRKLAAKHGRALVICDDPTNPKTLEGLEVDDRDSLLALTGWDEVNILACLVAKALGVSTTVSRFNRIEYVSLLGGVGIDAAVSSRLIAAGAILRFVRRGRIHSVVTFRDTDAEAIEIEVEAQSKAVGVTVVELGMPRGAVIGGVLRNGDTFVPTGASKIETGDRVIVFSMPNCIAAVEELFGRE
ncbi:MAG: Trk system potassium transporter TrkA [Acidimicrobiia bacterium]|nr:Trk system potassium transporter TrkA [Acidimicrobiia bacterium]MDH4309497.1 Trk system potassium transporter TrkA [Acidimicrobiia bacterium]